MSPFMTEVFLEAEAARDARPILGLRHAQQLISDAAAVLHVLIVEQNEQRPPCLPWEQARQHLVTIAAVCLRAAAQLRIESRQDAIGKEIPW